MDVEEQAPVLAKKAKTTSGASALAPDAKSKDTKKKSSTIGSGAAARKGKQGALGSSSKPSKTKA